MTNTVKAKCDIEVQFIVSEMERHHLLAQSNAGFKERFGEGHAALFEFMAKIRHSVTDREFVIGQGALRGFSTIAKMVIEDREDQANWDAAKLAERLKSTFLDYLFTEGIEDTADIVTPWISAAIRHVHARHRRIVHYLPCVALQIGATKSYTFGSITFTQKSVFYQNMTLSMSHYDKARNRLSERARRNAAPAMQSCWNERSDSKLKTTEEAFKDFTDGVDWIASVQVDRCDQSISEIRAEAALRIALSSMALLLEGTEGAGLRLAQDPFSPHQTKKLSSPGKGVVRPSSSWTFGTPKTHEGWQEHLETVATPVLCTIQELITKTLAGKPLSHGCQIALRAMTWYADAVRDTNVETRLIKCATAVECLVLPDRKTARAAFVIRGALLAQRENLPIAHWAAIATRLYERRSDVAHGNLDSLSNSQSESTRGPLEFTRNANLQFLVFCALPHFRGPIRTGTKKDFLDFYKHCEGGQHAEIAQVVTQYDFKTWKLVPAHSV